MTRSQFLSTLITKQGPDATLPECYAKLFSLGELFEMTQAKETPDPCIARRESILAAFQEEPMNKAESIALYEELAEIDQSLLFNPSEAMDTFPF